MKNVKSLDVDSLVAQFAKSTKASKAKAQALADALLSLPRHGLIVKNLETDRKINTISLQIRDELKALADYVKAEGRKVEFTGAELATRYNVDNVTLNNNLKWLSSMGTIKQNGYRPIPGMRGRPPALWVIG